MNKRQLMAIALGASLLVSALPGLALAQDEEAGFAAEDVNWSLDTLAAEAVPDGVEVTMLLSGGEVNGSAGCNTYFGGYEIDETTLTFPEPLATTRMLCEGPAQEVEDAYLPLLQSTAGWSVDDAGMLRLTDGEGAETLVYSEAVIDEPVEVMTSDVDALNAELESLQAQIETAEEEIAALIASFESVNINKIRNRISASEEDIAALEEKTKGLNVDNIKKRLKTLENAVADLDKQLQNTKKRVKTLETVAEDHEERITTLEATPEQPLP